MDCRDAFERLSADVDGELGAAETESLRRHLQLCEGCVRKRALLESIRRAFRSVAPESVSANFVDAVVRRLRPRFGIGWWLSAAAALAAALSLVLLREPETPQRFVASVPTPLAAVPNRQPGLNEGRMDAAADCGLPRAEACVIETPCGNGECSPAGYNRQPDLFRNGAVPESTGGV